MIGKVEELQYMKCKRIVKILISTGTSCKADNPEAYQSAGISDPLQKMW